MTGRGGGYSDDERPVDSGSSRRSSPEARRRTGNGLGPGSERRALRAAARRRRVRATVWLVTVPSVVVITLVVVLLVAFGGPDNQVSSTTLSTVAAQPGETGALLVVSQTGTIPDLALVQSRSAGGIVLGIPGITLLEAGDRFQLVSELAGGGENDLLAAALREAFGGQVASIAAVTWSDLRSALEDAGIDTLLSPTLTTDAAEAAQVAAAVLGLVRTGDSQIAERWERLPLTGDASGFRSAMTAFAGVGGDWISAAVTGSVAQTGGTTYLNPNADLVKVLLTSGPVDTSISVEVKNGSGALGIVEEAVAQLKPLGYQVSADGNADDFPGVVQTRVEISPGESDLGSRVRALLGLGAIVENQSLAPGQVVVVLGEDYTPRSGATESPDIQTVGS